MKKASRRLAAAQAATLTMAALAIYLAASARGGELGPTLVVLKQAGAWMFTFNTESSYGWKGKQWSVPVNAQVSKLVRFGKQPVSIGAGLRY